MSSVNCPSFHDRPTLPHYRFCGSRLLLDMQVHDLVIGSLLVDVRLSLQKKGVGMSPSRGGYVGEWTYVVSFLVNLVTDHIAGSLDTSAELGVAVFGNTLVGFLGGGRGGTLDGFGDVVGGVSMLNGCQ